ncbi:MAG: serine kinase [Rhodospirillaceae bacterium]
MSDYLLCGWRVRSDLPLPELPAWPGGDQQPPDITIRLGEVPERLTPLVFEGPFLQVDTGGLCRFEIAAVARYLVRAGREVVVAPQPAADGGEVRLFLFANVFGLLCHQRGVFPLHASCVEIDGRAVALAGESGVGKSTLAARIGQRGYRLLADDVCVVDWRHPAGPQVLPGVARLKLWADVLDLLNLPADPVSRLRAGMEKFIVPEPSGISLAPRPLAAVYHLRVDTRLGDQATFEPLRGFAAISALIEATSRRNAAIRMGGEKRLFEAASRVAAAVPTARLRRGADLAGLEALASAVIIRHGGRV